MYTNAGMLAMMTTANIIANYELVRSILADVESGKLAMSETAFDNHRRWEEDMSDFFVRRAEQLGITNARRSGMQN